MNQPTEQANRKRELWGSDMPSRRYAVNDQCYVMLTQQSKYIKTPKRKGEGTVYSKLNISSTCENDNRV